MVKTRCDENNPNDTSSVFYDPKITDFASLKTGEKFRFFQSSKKFTRDNGWQSYSDASGKSFFMPYPQSIVERV